MFVGRSETRSHKNIGVWGLAFLDFHIDQFIYKFSSTDFSILGAFKWSIPEFRLLKLISISVSNSQ